MKKQMRTRVTPLLALMGLLIFAVACGSGDPAATPVPPTQEPTAQAQTPTAEPQSFTVAFSDRSRAESPSVPATDLDELVNGNNAFAVDLYRQLSDEDGNLFMSPYSISLALAMTYAGAGGETADEMAQALHFTLEDEELHTAFNALDQLLAERGASQPEDEKFTLEIANSLWGQDGFEFEQPFLDTLAENYGAGMRLVDYDTRAEAARLAINGWVEENTNDRIKDLIPPDALNADTVLVLANAIFFKAAWREEFNPDRTSDGDFHLLDGSQVTAQMMSQVSSYAMTDGDGYSAVELPYVGFQTSMVVVMPDEGEFAEFEASLDAGQLTEIFGDLDHTRLDLKFPRFSFESKFSLPEPLKELGMEQAFDPLTSDFSVMRTPPPDLVISDVIHQSFVAVDEEGTEAAAATGVMVKTRSTQLDPEPFVVDRPFIFLIRDIPTDTVLFMGRLLDPSS